MVRLLVVHHSPTEVSRSLTDALLRGTRDPALAELGGPELEVTALPALEAGVDDLLSADGLVLATPANFGYMSGALKHFFDTVFLHAGGSLGEDGQGAAAGAGPSKLPYGLLVHGRYDTTGATRSVTSIAQALPWRAVVPPLELLGTPTDTDFEAAHELGATVAAITLEGR